MDKTLLSRNADIEYAQFPLKDGQMSGIYFGPNDQPVKLIFLHANGFHALAYRSLLEGLDIPVLALDMRGHGRTTLSTDQPFSFFNFAEDIAEFLNIYIKAPVTLGGHSLGAGASIFCASLAPNKVKRVVAFDPVGLPFWIRSVMRTGFGRRFLQKNLAVAKNAARRRARFPNHEHAFERYHKRGPFKAFSDEALWDYINGGFLPDGDTVRIACAPLWEQSNYITQIDNLPQAVRHLPAGSHVIVTDFIKQAQNWTRRIARKRPDLILDYKPNLDHLFPMINPDYAKAVIKRSVQG